MRKSTFRAISVFVLFAGVNGLGKTSQPATNQSDAAVGEAVKTLRESKDTKKWIEAVDVIARSSDEEAWGVMRAFLVNPDVLAVLRVPRVDTFDEDWSLRRGLPEAAAIFEKMARGTKGEETLLWLLKQKVYADFARDDHADDFPVIVFYEALEYVPNASGKCWPWSMRCSGTRGGHVSSAIDECAGGMGDERIARVVQEI